MSRDAAILLVEIQEAGKDILDHTHGMTLNGFLADRKTKQAVIRCLEVMGEAAKGLPPSIREAHPEVPWKDLCGMRDVLIHQYFGIDENRLWMAVERSVPPLLTSISRIQRSLPACPTDSQT
jgi:uncharacterized protein with HEPN domain